MHKAYATDFTKGFGGKIFVTILVRFLLQSVLGLTSELRG